MPVGTATALVQLGTPQLVPVGRRQTPAPLHVPSLPQALAESVAQTLRGSSPAGTGLQIPAEPARLQTEHNSVQGVPQQTPSTQYPLAHWEVAVQAAPATRLERQAPLSQKNPV
jgi:hypothetical protein